MRRLLAMAIVLCAASVAPARTTPQQQTAHPAVVRVISPERGSVCYGSGALVAVNETYGLVVTNWHVVRNAAGPVMVVFPDGFRSGARVLRTNRDWDLAALAIWRPNARPIALAEEAPQPGDGLTIIGYGPGWYRAATGRCIQYVSPGSHNPPEMVELSVGARNGDSGGPILNSRGELAGVLFGSAFGRTTGSYCGRVRWFLASVADDFGRLPGNTIGDGGTMIAGRPAGKGGDTRIAASGARPFAAATDWPARERPDRLELAQLPAARPRQAPTVAISGRPAQAVQPPAATAVGPTRAEKLKTILAAIGVFALLVHALRLVAKMQES